MSARAAALLAGLALLAACSPAPAPAPTPAPPAPPAPAPLPAPSAAPPHPALADQPPPGAYLAHGAAPAWQARATGGRLTLRRPGAPDATLDVFTRAYARGLEFEGQTAAGRVTLSLTSEAPCTDPPAYAATLIVAGEAFKGCASVLP